MALEALLRVISKHSVAARSCQRWVRLVPLVIVALSCQPQGDDDSSNAPPLGKVTQALTDTDSDGMDDAWEVAHFGNLSQTASGDFDGDGMTNLEEFTYGFDPTVNDAFADADGDRYPNIFEIRRGSDPNDAGSIPTPNYTVNAAGGGTHTTVGAALTAATTASGLYQIIGIAPGVYTTSANSISIAATKPRLLVIGLEGAAKTVIDGIGSTNFGWGFHTGAVIASLTFHNCLGALYVDAAGQEVRFVDLVVSNNDGGPTYNGGLEVVNAAKTYLTGSTFVNNIGASNAQQIYFAAGAGIITNTVVWNSGTGTMVAKAYPLHEGAFSTSAAA